MSTTIPVITAATGSLGIAADHAEIAQLSQLLHECKDESHSEYTNTTRWRYFIRRLYPTRRGYHLARIGTLTERKAILEQKQQQPDTPLTEEETSRLERYIDSIRRSTAILNLFYALLHEVSLTIADNYILRIRDWEIQYGMRSGMLREKVLEMRRFLRSWDRLEGPIIWRQIEFGVTWYKDIIKPYEELEDEEEEGDEDEYDDDDEDVVSD
ncbi:hypothetical protein ABW19_dt0201945 [Dactylella cylindrospora]|nr:hypothetical protein ABW19_dt0201945 [Dactylella cylindrospora]